MQCKAVEVVCPECGWVQKFRPKKGWSKVKDDHRTECNKCERSFKVKTQRKEKTKTHRRKKNDSDTPFGYHKYSKSSNSKEGK